MAGELAGAVGVGLDSQATRQMARDILEKVAWEVVPQQAADMLQAYIEKSTHELLERAIQEFMAKQAEAMVREHLARLAPPPGV